MTYQFLTTRIDGPVEHLVLNRPDVRNAFNEHVIAELTAWAHDARARASRGEVRVVVLSGAGKTFCAGADVTWMSKTIAYTEEENLRDAAAMSQMFSALDNLPLPLVGRIHGAALGGGAGLAAVCDIVVADEHAMFGFTEVRARDPAGGDFAVRAREDRAIRSARAVPDRRAIHSRARQGDRAGPRSGAGAPARQRRRDVCSRISWRRVPRRSRRRKR